MYFSGLRRTIGSVEEKRFYDVALMYLDQQGYSGLSIVDGSGDGGRDVVCLRKDLRIQLSVRADWQNKINAEAATALSSGTPHLIYVTNRPISPQAEQDFLDKKFKYKGQVDLVIHDLNRISTALARPSSIRRSYEILGLQPEKTVTATPKEIAISTVLLFSDEAKELRDNLVDAYIRAWLLKNPRSPEEILVPEVNKIVPGASVSRNITSALSRLRASGKIVGPSASIELSQDETAKMQAAEDEFNLAFQSDVKFAQAELGTNKSDTETLLRMSMNLLYRQKDLDGAGQEEQNLRREISVLGLQARRAQVYEVLSKSTTPSIVQYGATVDRMFETDTFDIYRALGRRTDLSMVLDSSVAMPMIFGLEFGVAQSRYGRSASTLKQVCQEHGIKVVVPTCYINEMAFHGYKALEYLEVYGALPEDVRTVLRGSENAYLSHYSHIRETVVVSGGDLSLQEFLRHFGITKGSSLQRIENRITTILDNHGIIGVVQNMYNPEIKKRIVEEKPNDPAVIINHDALVCTMMQENSENGYILATWDRVLMDAVEDLARVYADTPARVVDFLSMAEGESFESKQNMQMLSSLLHCDERPIEKLARKLEKIDTTEAIAKLQIFVDESRGRREISSVLKDFFENEGYVEEGESQASD